jgi:branched-chain amino acid transport system substrate-binding protein
MQVPFRRLTYGLAVAAAMGMAGCASSGSSGSGGSGSLTVGVIYPFTGPNADEGPIGMAGCLSGADAVNAAGGVLGHKFVCQSFDTKGDPADAATAANQMMASANPVVVIGASDDAVTTAPIVTAAHVPNFATIGDPHFDHQANPYFYRITPSDALQGTALGYWAATHFTRPAAVFTSDLGAQTSVPPLRSEYTKLHKKLVADVTLAPGQSSYRTEVAKIAAAHPDALISEMDPQSSTTFLSEYLQVYAHWLLKLGGKVKDPSQYLQHPYAIADYDAVNITALAMTEAHSASPARYNPLIPKVTAPSPGAVVVHSYAQGLAALKAGKHIQYVGAGGTLVFNAYHSAERSFSYDSFDAAAKSMNPVAVIPGSALNG